MPEFVQVFRNTLFLWLARLSRPFASVFVTVAIAHQLLEEGLGAYTFAITYYLTFQSIASIGLKSLLTREVAKAPGTLWQLLTTALVLIIPTCFLVMAVAVAMLPIFAGVGLGYLVGGRLPVSAPPVIVQALGGSFLGYLTAAGLVWAVRILGTLAFGREAMGLGDVHLMGAIGAVLGWVDPIFIFLLAPFFGLSWAFMSMGMSSLFRKKRRELPYGPHLAIATLVVLLCRPAVNWVEVNYLPGLQQAGLIQPRPSP